MNIQENNIDWDRLLDALENDNISSLTQEEMAAFNAAREMKQRLTHDRKFPVEEGWQRFVSSRNGGKLRLLWIRRLSVAATIAAVIVGAVFLWPRNQRSEKRVAALRTHDDTAAINKVRIKLSNGKTITVDNSAPSSIRHNNGSSVQLGEGGIVYESGSDKTSAAQQFDSLFVPRGNKIHITLADGTGVWVNADSKLVFPAAFNGNTREVWIEGEAFFEVAPEARQPFVVHTKEVEVKVLGTSFNLNTYEASTQTTLTSGKVSVTADAKTIVLSPGWQANYQRGNAIQQLEVDTRIFTSWKDGNIYFEEAALSTIMKNLCRSFDYDFRFTDPSLEKLSFTLDIQKPASLRQVLEYLTLTNQKVRFQIEGKMVLISPI
jgi:transmembrane sensor